MRRSFQVKALKPLVAQRQIRKTAGFLSLCVPVFIFLLALIPVTYPFAKKRIVKEFTEVKVALDWDYNPDGVPTYLSINGESWWLLPEKFLGTDIAAETDCKQRVIFYIPTTDVTHLHRNLMHEIYHAGACIHGDATYWNTDKKDLKSHAGIYHLGDFSENFFASNPTFTRWLLSNK